MTFAEKVIAFNSNLKYRGSLPDGIRIMNPFLESAEALKISSVFYNKYYNDSLSRKLILGINPGRHGAGITGVPFTDTKRMESHCGLKIEGFNSHELSSVFVYDVIDAFGGPVEFYSQYYINSVCPLGFVSLNAKGREVNYNYYDSTELFDLVKPFIVESIIKQIGFGIDTETVYCLGTGKNHKFLKQLNQEYSFFENIVPVEHPRYIMQYKLKSKNNYIAKFCDVLG